MGEVTGPIIATTMVLLAVFVPTAMMGGITGRLYSQFAMTIATATVFSSINALTLSPALCGVLLRPTPKKLGWFFSGFNRVFDATTGGYMRVVNGMVRRTIFAVILLVVLMGLTVFGFLRIPGGFLPDEDQGYFMISAQLPDGTTLQRTEAVMARIDELLKEVPGISDVISVDGYSALDALMTPNCGTFFVVLDPWDERAERSTQIEAVLDSIRPQLAEIRDAVVLAFLPPPITGLGNAGGFEFQLQDRGNAGIVQLEAIAGDFVYEGTEAADLARMNSNLRASVPQLYLDVDRVKVKKVGVPLETVFGTLQAFLGSAYVNDFNKFGRVYRVMIQADHQFRNKISDIENLFVRNGRGDMIPLETLLDTSDTAGPQTVFRFNMYSSSTITGQAATGYSSGQAIRTMEAVANRVLPGSMGYEWSGVTYQQIEAGVQAPIIFTLAIVFVFLFLAAQYESWSIPLAVIFSVPLAILGALGATWVRAYDNNIYTQIGLVLLIGLSCKSAILIVEFAKVRREQGQSIVQAATGAARLRFRAILMTAFSFILGVVPLVIASGAGAASRRALGTAVFGGMLAATVLGVFFIPTLYVVVQGVSERLRGIPGNTDEEQ